MDYLMRAVLCTLLFLLYDPVIQTSAIVRQQEQPASYRVYRVTVEGANALSSNQILLVSKLKAGRVVDEQNIATARAAILRAYSDLGRIRAGVRIQTDFKAAIAGAKQTHADVKIQIDEGAIFALRRLEIIGNATTNDRIVRRRVLLQQGEAYSQERMEQSLSRLNALGRFEKLTMSDVEIDVDEQQHLVDLLLHIKEIKRNQTRR